MEPWCVPLISALSCVLLFLPGGNGALKLYFYINSARVRNDTTYFLPQGTTTGLSCQYDRIFPQPSLVEVNHEGLQITNFPVQSYTDQQSNVFVRYTVPANQATGSHIYRCVQTEAIFIQVTITFGGGQVTTNPPTTRPPPATRPTRSSIPPPSTQGSGGTQPQFAGLNPLIYTISAVILLGTLAIVAIVTCWIRARRSFNSRLLRSNNTPQDYLDYISDNEFTPMTTSEFLASLQERPPTYNESEQSQSNTRPAGDQSTSEGDGGNSDNPPVNPGQQGSARTTSSSGGASREPSGHSVSAGTGSGTGRSNGGTSSSRRHDSASKTQERRTVPIVGNLVDVEVDAPVCSECVPQRQLDCLTPTQDQISEIEATVGAVNERMRLIHERERQLNLRLEDSTREEEEDSVTGEPYTLGREGIPLLDIQM